MIKDSGERTVFETGAQRDVPKDKGRMDLLPCRALISLSKHFEEGARKYEDRNWEKGIPLHNFFSSGLRHACQYLMGKRDEPHLQAACWNFLCALETILRIEEGILPESLNDLPSELDDDILDSEELDEIYDLTFLEFLDDFIEDIGSLDYDDICEHLVDMSYYDEIKDVEISFNYLFENYSYLSHGDIKDELQSIYYQYLSCDNKPLTQFYIDSVSYGLDDGQ
jgi:hypothetical protein